MHAYTEVGQPSCTVQKPAGGELALRRGPSVLLPPSAPGLPHHFSCICSCPQHGCKGQESGKVTEWDNTAQTGTGPTKLFFWLRVWQGEGRHSSLQGSEGHIWAQSNSVSKFTPDNPPLPGSGASTLRGLLSRLRVFPETPGALCADLPTCLKCQLHRTSSDSSLLAQPPAQGQGHSRFSINVSNE